MGTRENAYSTGLAGAAEVDAETAGGPEADGEGSELD
jgi:hypothetical protein